LENISLDYFIDAQNANFDRALSELTLGKKRNLWIWYIFPQIAGLGFSEPFDRYDLRKSLIGVSK